MEMDIEFRAKHLTFSEIEVSLTEQLKRDSR